LVVDEINWILDDHRGQLGSIEWTAAVLRAMTWWLSLECADRAAWQGWVERDIQRLEIHFWMKQSKID
jgi:hypothetical protein